MVPDFVFRSLLDIMEVMNFRLYYVGILLLTSFYPAINASASSGFSMEVMTIEGEALYGSSLEQVKPMHEEDLIPPGYTIVVKKDSYVDIALDPNWENIIRITGPATAIIRSIFPTDIRLEYGSIYSRLPSLPMHSTHEIQTPLAVAAVRGSEYLVEHTTETEVFNFSASPVFVFGTTAEGNLLGNPNLLHDNQMTGISGIGINPSEQKVMTKEQLQSGLAIRKSILANTEIAKSTRIAKTESLKNVQNKYIHSLKERLSKKIEKTGKNTPLTQADYSKLLGSDRRLDRELSDLFEGGGASIGTTSGTGDGSTIGTASTGTSTGATIVGGAGSTSLGSGSSDAGGTSNMDPKTQ